MLKFLNKIFIFFSFLILFFSVNAISNYLIILNTDPKVKASSILIIGDSHARTSLNPILFNDAESISQNTEPYILTFWKLKRVIDNVRPDTVMIGFAPHNISAFNDLKFDDKRWSTEMFRRSYSIQNFNSITSVEIDFVEFYKVLWKQIGVYPKTTHFSNFGGYSNSETSDISDVNNTIEKHYYFENEYLGVSETAILYLDSILGLCKEYNVVPILISSPVHKSYFNLIPEHIKKRYYCEQSKLKSRGIIVIDMTTNYYADSLYLNSDHLNEKGAVRFTNEIQSKLNLLEGNNNGSLL